MRLALDVVHDVRSSTILFADLTLGIVVADHRADLREQRLHVDRQRVVGNPERDLDQLEVVEVAVLGFLERLLGLAGLDERERAVDRAAHLLHLRYRVLA